MNSGEETPKAAETQKKPYRSPVVTDYGTVAKLAQTGISGSRGDGGANPKNRRV
jgi:hypothetical protein